MSSLKPGDPVVFNGKEYVVVEVNEETDTASLVPIEDVVQEVPFDDLKPLPDAVT